MKDATQGGVLERAYIARLHDADFNAFLDAPPAHAREYTFRMTSGTTGAPLFIVREVSAHPNELIHDARHTLVCHASSNVNLGNVLYVRTTENSAQRVCAVTPADLDALPQLLEDLRPDCVYGTPSFIERIMAGCSDAVRGAVRRAAFNGEAVTQALEERMHALMPSASIESVYISVETGAISGIPCGHLGRGMYHPKPGVVVEISGTDADGAGDILVSTQFGKKRRIERYRIGDIGRIIEGACACGAAHTFEVLGRRGYDYVKVAGALFHRAEFDRVAGRCADFFDDYRIEVSENSQGGADVLVRVYRTDGMWDEDIRNNIAAGMSDAFVGPDKTLRDVFPRGFTLRVERATDPFERRIKDVKITYRV